MNSNSRVASRQGVIQGVGFVKCLLMVLTLAGGAQAYYNAYGMSYTRYLCSPEECISNEIKETLIGCFSEPAKKLWEECIGETKKCSPGEEWKINQCIYQSVENMTEITVREYREIKNKLFTQESLLECAGDKITLTMQNCTMNPAPKYNTYRYNSYNTRNSPPRTYGYTTGYVKPVVVA